MTSSTMLLLQFIYVSYSISFDKVTDGKKYEIVFPPDNTWYIRAQNNMAFVSEYNNKSGPKTWCVLMLNRICSQTKHNS